MTDRQEGPRRPQAGLRPGDSGLGGGASPLGGLGPSGSEKRPQA